MEKIRKYIENLFTEAPKTKGANDFKEELIADLEEKYNDLIKSGSSEKEAYNEVIAGIGDIDELISSLKDPVNTNHMYTENMLQTRKKTATIVSISVGLFIFSIIALITAEEIGMPDFLSVSLFFMIAGLATCMLVYHFISMPKYQKRNDTLVEEFKEWKQGKSKSNEIRKSIISILWTLTFTVYLLVSFIFGIWYISWIIFIIAIVFQNIINLIFKMKE